MIYGIAAGLFFAGLLGSAITGSIWILIGYAAAGLLTAGAGEAVKLYRAQQAAHKGLSQYPPYKY